MYCLLVVFCCVFVCLFVFVLFLLFLVESQLARQDSLATTKITITPAFYFSVNHSDPLCKFYILQHLG